MSVSEIITIAMSGAAIVVSVIALLNSLGKTRYDRQKDRDAIQDEAKNYILDTKLDKKVARTRNHSSSTERSDLDVMMTILLASDDVKDTFNRLPGAVQKEIYRQLGEPAKKNGLRRWLAGLMQCRTQSSNPQKLKKRP